MTSTPSTANIIPLDDSSVFDVLKKLSTNQQQIALVRPNNPPPGIAGYLFDIPDEEVWELRTEISQHFIEDNTTIQDQMALPPERFTVRGMVAELVFVPPTTNQIASPVDPLVDNPSMVPQLTPGVQQTQDQTVATNDATEGSLESAQSLYSVYDRLSGQQPNQTKQAKIALYFYQLWKGRQLFSVETPWGTMNNMGISLARFEQSGETKGRSDFTITFEHIRFAQSPTVNTGQLAGRAVAQQSPTTQNGPAGLTTTTDAESQSLLRRMTKGFVSP